MTSSSLLHRAVSRRSRWVIARRARTRRTTISIAGVATSAALRGDDRADGAAARARRASLVRVRPCRRDALLGRQLVRSARRRNERLAAAADGGRAHRERVACIRRPSLHVRDCRRRGAVLGRQSRGPARRRHDEPSGPSGARRRVAAGGADRGGRHARVRDRRRRWVWCGGRNGAGQLGNGSREESEVPVHVPNLISDLDATAIAADGDHACDRARREPLLLGQQQQRSARRRHRARSQRADPHRRPVRLEQHRVLGERG